MGGGFSQENSRFSFSSEMNVAGAGAGAPAGADGAGVSSTTLLAYLYIEAAKAIGGSFAQLMSAWQHERPLEDFTAARSELFAKPLPRM